MNSFIKWIGGKKFLRKKIISEFPTQYDRYIEVFGGAGWVLFGQEYHCSLEVLNDKNNDLINLYRCVKFHCQELIKELNWILQSRKLFFECREQLKGDIGLTDIQRAARFYILIKFSYGADLRSFSTRSVKYLSSIDDLYEIQKRLEKVIIENRDFRKIINTYDTENALFYLDPPYFQTEKYYDCVFTKQDHEDLHRELMNLKGKFVLSYNDCEFIRDLYQDFNIKSISRYNTLCGDNGNIFKELIIKNY